VTTETREPVRRGGRPSRLEAEALGEKILDVATDLFLADGYAATSIETIAARAQISKRTFYHRFADKSALFGAVVHRVVSRLRPPADTQLYEGGALDAVLTRLARLMLHAVLSPPALALHRLMIAEAQRFPELAAAVAGEGTAAGAIEGIAALLRREAAPDHPLPAGDADFAAAQFMQLVMSIPQRRALGLGTPLSAEELDRWAERSVRLFLRGWPARR
jgi:AcrR family transcriptional regulator